MLQTVLSRSAQERWICFERRMDSYVVVGRPWEGHLHSNERDEVRGFTHANVALRQFLFDYLAWESASAVFRFGLGILWPLMDVYVHSTVGQGWLPEVKCPWCSFSTSMIPLYCFFSLLGWDSIHNQKDQLPCFCWSRGGNCFLGGEVLENLGISRLFLKRCIQR